MDEQIRAQLEMLEQINNNAFSGGSAAAQADGQPPETNPTEIGKMMTAMLKQQKEKAEQQATISVEYKSGGAPFMD